MGKAKDLIDPLPHLTTATSRHPERRLARLRQPQSKDPDTAHGFMPLKPFSP
jgi:hypothetical protein